MNQEQEDFAAKLLLLEREADLVLNELPGGLARDRLLHVVTIARLLRARLGVASGVILPARAQRKDDQ